MVTADAMVRLSKQMSRALRHRPDRAGITLDEAGWVDLDLLATALRRPASALVLVAEASDKQRFEIVDGRIRARQGHSVDVDLGLPPAVPPDVLYHGTVEASLESIMRDGLLPGRRHAVHLSPDVETATRVGSRRGRPVVLVVDAAAMTEHSFTVTGNGVWLVDHVPARRLRRLTAEPGSGACASA